MKAPYLTIEPHELAEYMRSNDLVNLATNKAYEFSAALIIVRYFYIETGKVFKICLPLKATSRDLHSAAEAIKEHVDEDTPIDIAIVDVDHSNKVIAAEGFQLKRYRLNGRASTLEIIQYLTEGKPVLYDKTKTSLVLLLEGTGQLNKKDINDVLNSLDKFPFENVRYICGDGENEIRIGEIWPKLGESTFKTSEWFNAVLPGEENSIS